MLKKILGVQQRKFIINAILVWGLTQIALHSLLFTFDISIATITSSLVYLILGFNFYGKNVFNIKKYRNLSFLKFLLMSIFLWFINFCGIHLFNSLLNHKNLSAILMITPLASISFLIQKYIVFK